MLINIIIVFQPYPYTPINLSRGFILGGQLQDIPVHYLG